MKMGQSVEKYLLDAIDEVGKACEHHRQLHLSHAFIRCGGDQGVVAVFVTCPDDMANELKEAVDETIRELFTDRGMLREQPERTQ